jgi:uncharacterized membrane protein
MNSAFGRWLLDLDIIPADGRGVHLAWEHPWPAWIWLIIVLLAAAVAVWSYSRLVGVVRWRWALASVRALVLLLAAMLIAGPVVELPREIVEPDCALLLLDRSESMQVPDVQRGAARITRDEQLRDILDAATDPLAEAQGDRRLIWLGFHSGAYELPTTGDAEDAPSRVELDEPTGGQTRLDRAITQALQRSAGRQVAGIVLLSDGRTIDPPSRATIRRLQAEAVKVFPVPLGSRELLGDVAIAQVDQPRRAFVGDTVPVTVQLQRTGEAGNRVRGSVQLVDELTGEVLDERPIPDDRDRLLLNAVPSLSGTAAWKVVVNPDGGDLVAENNESRVEIELVDRPVRVLYVEGYPRWEYRFLKNLLVREKSIESSVMLLSADRDFAQEGNAPITRIPRSPEELDGYDLVILGDLPGSFFSPDQLMMLRDHVGQRGAGLLWIAGERDTPGSYAATVLADPLPIRGSLKLSSIRQPVNMTPTPLADRLGVLQMVLNDEIGWPQELADEQYGWSQLYWAQRIEPGMLKPAAEVLAETVQTVDGEASPLVIAMRFGAGQVVYVATDEIWRWRYGRGEVLPEQFWIQIIRMLARQRLAGGGDGALLTVSPRRAELDQPVLVELRIIDAQLTDDGRASVLVDVLDEQGGTITTLELVRESEASDRYTAVWRPGALGRYQMRISDGLLAGLAEPAEVDIYTRADELSRPETDHDLLETLAAETGGRVLGPVELAALNDILPNRSIRTSDPIRESIWDTPLALILVLLFLTLEWIGRKLMRYT